MCSLGIERVLFLRKDVTIPTGALECVLLLLCNVFSFYRMCSLAIECHSCTCTFVRPCARVRARARARVRVGYVGCVSVCVRANVRTLARMHTCVWLEWMLRTRT